MIHKKIKWIFIILGIIVLAFGVGNIKKPILVVNGQKIYKDEYWFYVTQAKSNIYNYFYHKYGVQAGDLDWEKDYGDGQPIDRLIDECNAKAVENNLIWQEAYERDITNYATFEDFQKVWQHEMQRRKKDYEAGKVVYGPIEMGLIEYYDYALSDLKSKVMDAIWKEASYTDEQLEAYFETIKEDAYVRDIQIEGIKISTFSLEEEEQKALEETRQLLMNSTDIHETLKSIEANGEFEITEVAFNEETSRMDQMKQPDIKEAVLKMSVGEVSPIFVNDISREIIVVTHVEEADYYSFEEMKGGVEQRCKEQIMEEYMKNKLEEAERDINYNLIKKSILGGF